MSLVNNCFYTYNRVHIFCYSNNSLNKINQNHKVLFDWWVKVFFNSEISDHRIVSMVSKEKIQYNSVIIEENTLNEFIAL
jgi:hypothetical protein